MYSSFVKGHFLDFIPIYTLENSLYIGPSLVLTIMLICVMSGKTKSESFGNILSYVFKLVLSTGGLMNRLFLLREISRGFLGISSGNSNLGPKICLKGH